DSLAVITLIVLGTLFFADVLFGVNNFYMRDLTRYYYPTKQILREIVLGGEFPFWNPWFSAGQPIAANPEHEVFYPLTWLILLPDYDLGYRLHVLVHVYIGLLGMYAFLRSMELRPFAAFFGALSWGLGGLYLSYINLLPILFCVAWLPLTCLFTRRCLLHPGRRDFALASLFLGLQFLVGEPTTIMQTGFLLGMYALYRGWHDGDEAPDRWRVRLRSSLRHVGWVAAISAAGFLVGAAQGIPAFDHVGDSARSRPFGFELVSAWSFPWAKLAEMLYPNILGHISIDRVMWYWGGGLYPGMGSPFLFSIYNGLLVMALAVGSAFVRPRGGRLVLILAAFSILLALGSHTPLLKLLYDSGLATAVRYPEKFALIAGFAVIVFAAQMLQRMLDGDSGVRDGALGFLFAVFLVALLITLSTLTPLYGRFFSKMWSLSGQGAAKMISISTTDWIVATLRGGIAIGLLLTVHTRRRPAWIAAAAIFIAADLALVTSEINPRMPRRFFTSPPLDDTLPKNRDDYRIFHEADWYGQEATARQWFSTGDAVYWIVRNGLFPMTPVASRLRMVLERDYDKTALLPTIDLTDSLWDVKRAGRPDWYRPFMAMSNAWYRAVYRDFEQEKKRVRGNLRNAVPIRFLEGEHHPRYYFADQMITIRDRHDFVRKLTTNTYSSSVAFVTAKGFVPARGVVRGVSESANRATIEVETSGRAFLVM
ncbi:MAG TPA: hypothetical protein VNL91_08990, partial [Thermoanaerobaculia bacterium]|nr:hypothetical protein [Thermoanaerobaculia bacterium]